MNAGATELVADAASKARTDQDPRQGPQVL